MEGSCDTDWDVDKYRSPYEPSHHWELKKKFMEANKGRYPEEKLVSLTQVFANAEFMGCRYPKETMETIEEMSFGIVQPYRESQKNRLQRTFVSGSDAASGKVNRSKPGKPKWIVKWQTFWVFLTALFVLGLKRKLEINDDETVPAKKIPTESPSQNEHDFIIIRLKYEENEHACNILHRSAGFSKTTISWEYKSEDTSFRCNVKLQNSLIHSATGDFTF